MEMSGQQALGIKEDGEYVTYQFAIPKSGCKIVPKIKQSRSQGAAVPMNQAAAAKCQEMMEALVKQLMTNKVGRTTNGGIRK